MSLSININEFPLHNINTIKSTVLILGLIKIFLLLQILLHRKRITSFLLGFQSHDDDDAIKSSHQENKLDDHDVCRGDQMEMVLKSLGIFLDGDDQVPTRMDADEIFDIFEQRKPCLDEVKEAFQVFDSNRDGMIDERELHKVLCALGLKEGLEMDNCRRMIAAFDEDGDGRIDFQEFVNFMENTFT